VGAIIVIIVGLLSLGQHLEAFRIYRRGESYFKGKDAYINNLVANILKVMKPRSGTRMFKILKEIQQDENELSDLLYLGVQAAKKLRALV
jgi:hypothetical protein